MKTTFFLKESQGNIFWGMLISADNFLVWMIYQGPVVQSIVSLTSSLVVKMLTVLVSKISDLQVFLLKKCEYVKNVNFFFSKNISVYAIFNNQSFNNMLSNNIVSFEQLGPDILLGMADFW